MGARRSAMRGAGRYGSLVAFAAGGLLFATSTCFAEEPLQLSIASMNVAGKQIAPVQPEAPAPVWRHTFGAERRTVATQVRQPVRFSADIVVLQGVTNLAPVRQMFPARKYHVVVSRQLLQQADPTGTQHAPLGTTALAIRRETGLRVTAQDHLLDLAEPPSGAAIALAAATAVRLLSPGRSLWVVALDLAQGCPAQDLTSATADVRCLAAKKQLDAIDNWLAQRIASGEAVIMAGRLHRQLETSALPGHLGRLSGFSFHGETPPACTGSGIETTTVLATPGSHTEGKVVFNGKLEPVDEATPESGCFLLVDATL